MPNPFVRKLRHGADLTEADEAILLDLAQPLRRIEARGDIVREGTEPRALVLVVEGWACRYKQLENGKRQIISFFLPGDLCEPFGILPRFMDHALGALTPVAVAHIQPGAIRNAARASRCIEEALWWDLLAAVAADQERVVSLGRRSAAERLGHLFCELQLRLAMVGLADPDGYDLPVTQVDLADLLGLSSVHVNRSLQELRATGLLSLKGRRLTIHDLKSLQEASLFDPGYLHTGGVSLA
jgi:CRP-like cAMP-binding protein